MFSRQQIKKIAHVEDDQLSFVIGLYDERIVISHPIINLFEAGGSALYLKHPILPAFSFDDDVSLDACPSGKRDTVSCHAVIEGLQPDIVFCPVALIALALPHQPKTTFLTLCQNEAGSEIAG